MALAAGMLVGLAGAAGAHQSSTAYLQVQAGARTLDVGWDIALRDLDLIVPVDADDDRRITWGEWRAALPGLSAALPGQLTVPGCPLAVTGASVERRADGAYLALRLHADCTPPAGLPLRYHLLAGVDATHRAVASVRHADGHTEARLVVPALAAVDETAPPAGADRPTAFFREGIRHLLGGTDHLLFLLCLLLPAVLRRDGRHWTPLPRAREALLPTARIVTLFTLAHSLTLMVAVLGGVRLSPGLVEPAIAATIGVAAIDNLRPLFGRWRPAVPFAFGLVHGFGFAGVLAELNLPPWQAGWALLQFNLGLETAQLAVVATVVPLLALWRARPSYPRWVLGAGSGLATLVAVAWFVQRVAAAGAV